MAQLWKYIKKYLWMVLILMLLSTLEVVAETFVVKLTGNTVSIGIEKSGIENSIPLVIDGSTKNNVIKFANNQDKRLISDSFQKLIHKDQIQKNTKLKNITINFQNKNLYLFCDEIWKEQREENTEKLNQIFTLYFSLVASENDHEIKKFLTQETGLELTQPLFEQICNLSDTNKRHILNIIYQNMNKISGNSLSQLITQKIKSNYQQLNIDIHKIQNNYIKKASISMLIYTLLSDIISWILIILISSICSSGISRDLKSDLFKKISNFSKLELEKFSIPSLITRTTNDITQIQFFIAIFLENIFFAPIYGVVAFKQAYRLNQNMSWVIIYILVVMLVIIVAILLSVVPKFNMVQKLIDKINLVTREILNGLLSIRAFNTQKFEEKRFDQENKKITKIHFFTEKIMSAITPLILLISHVAQLTITFVSYRYVSNYTLQIGDIMEYINYTVFVIMSFIMLSTTIIEFPRFFISLKRVLAVLREKSSISDVQTVFENINQNNNFNGHLLFQNVSFNYSDTNHATLKDISFEVKPGTTTAIVGATGSGKSTIINLIQRFCDVSNGEILLDDVNIKNIPLSKLREQISYAPQKGILFKGTIESNIKYGNSNISNEELDKIIDIAKAKDFINKKRKKLLSEISQGGTNVSGGQRQRLSIARAIAKQAKIYIFDDCFSALDFKTDSELRKNLSEFLNNVSIIIVAQRIRTILNADQIIVLDNGKIVGKGTHQELIKNCKQYYDLAKDQLPDDMLS